MCSQFEREREREMRSTSPSLSYSWTTVSGKCLVTETNSAMQIHSSWSV